MGGVDFEAGGTARRQSAGRRRATMTAIGLTILFCASGAAPAFAHGSGRVEVGRATIDGTTVVAWSEADAHGDSVILVVAVEPTPQSVRMDLGGGDITDLSRHVDSEDGSSIVWTGPLPAGSLPIDLVVGDGDLRTFRLERTTVPSWFRSAVLVLGAQCLLVALWHLTRARRAFTRPTVHVPMQTREATT